MTGERLRPSISLAKRTAMTDQPETITVKTRRVQCDGASDIPGGAALGHPRVWLEIDETGSVECGYCDRRFILANSPAARR
jgi:NADH dehydrogenase (ubiquinone) Fe-S protein 6